MKKISFFIIAIAIIGFGCKKQNTTPQTTSIDPTADKIEQFLKAVESDNRSGTDMTITDAIWNVEAALNYAYCDMSISPIKIDYDTINFEIPVSNNMINWNDVVILYSYCQQEMNTYASTFDSPTFFRLVDLEKKGILKGNLVVKFSVVIGEKEERTIPPVGYFTNSWMYGMNLGTCNSGSPSGSSDLAQEIKWRINFYVLTYPVGTYFTDIGYPPDYLYATDYLNPNDSVTGDNYYDYMMLVANGNAPNYHLCYSPAECNFYFDGTNWVIHTDINNGGYCPVGKTPMNIDILEATLIAGNKNTTWLHWGEVMFGVMHHQR